jgi:hypothetical protein
MCNVFVMSLHSEKPYQKKNFDLLEEEMMRCGKWGKLGE